MLHEELTAKVLKGYYTVYNTLRYGFLEKVYERALAVEYLQNGLSCKTQGPIKVYYTGYDVGLYFADIIVDEVLIIEIKAAESLCVEHEAQLTNYLRATNIEVGLLLNFGQKPQFKRKVFENKFKKSVPIR